MRVRFAKPARFVLFGKRARIDKTTGTVSRADNAVKEILGNWRKDKVNGWFICIGLMATLAEDLPPVQSPRLLARRLAKLNGHVDFSGTGCGSVDFFQPHPL